MKEPPNNAKGEVFDQLRRLVDNEMLGSERAKKLIDRRRRRCNDNTTGWDHDLVFPSTFSHIIELPALLSELVHTLLSLIEAL